MYIRSPISYTGNKFRILSDIIPVMDTKNKKFVDLFCGGGTVGFNILNASKTILIDNNEHIISLLKTIAEYKIETLVKEITFIAEEYNLSLSYKYGYEKYRNYIYKNNGFKKYNLEGFNNLKKDFNKMDKVLSKQRDIYLLVLIAYSFNNDFRFNLKGEFNMPVGKTDISKNFIKKLENYIQRAQKINFEFICADYTSEVSKKIIKDSDIIYIDPPYLITNAFYNESSKWNEESENRLLNFIKENIINKGKKFYLSNLLSRGDVTNVPLSKFIKENNLYVLDIKYKYTASSYNKKNRYVKEREVLICNEISS